MQRNIPSATRSSALATGAAAAFAALLEISFALSSGNRLDAGYVASVQGTFVALSLALGALLGALRLPMAWILAAWAGASAALVGGAGAGIASALAVVLASRLIREPLRSPVQLGLVLGGLVTLAHLAAPRVLARLAPALALHGLAEALTVALGLGVSFAAALLVLGRLRARLSPASATALLCAALSLASLKPLLSQYRYLGDDLLDPAAEAPVTRPLPPHVFVLILDTVRADQMSVYGYGRETTPALARHLARRPDAVRYELGFSNGTWTVPSHATLFSGRLASEHGADFGRGPGGAFAVAAQRTLAEALRGQGWATACVYANFWLSRVSGMERGFDYYRHAEHPVGLSLFGEHLRARLVPSLFAHRVIGGPLAADVNRILLDALRRSSGKPTLVVANYTDAHAPYVPPPAFRGRFAPWSPFEEPRHLAIDLPAAEIERLRARYDEEILALDHALGELFDALAARGVLDESWIFVTSDHGEAFGEHGLTEHGTGVYNEITRVPMIVFPPRGVELTDHGHPVSLVDVTTTVAALAGVEGFGTGRDLRRAPIEAPVTILEFFGDPSKAGQHGALAAEPAQVVVRGSHKLIRTRLGLELYDLANDPREEVDLASREPERVRELEALLPTWKLELLEQQDWSKHLSPHDLRRLRDLGYLGDG